MDSRKIEQILIEAIDEVNEQLEEGVSIAHASDTLLYGIDAQMDSLDLVNLIVTFEQKIDDRLGVKITLANEKALSMRQSPFRTVGALHDYACTLVKEAMAHV